MKDYIINQAIEASAPANVRPSSVSKTIPPRLDFSLRHRNRQLPTNKLLELLRSDSRLWELAEVVGKWVWIQFSEKQPREITAALSQLGFHWNYKRQTWQHPCGTWNDPRGIYRSYFPADTQAAA
jgi:hypothetical protein